EQLRVESNHDRCHFGTSLSIPATSHPGLLPPAASRRGGHLHRRRGGSAAGCAHHAVPSTARRAREPDPHRLTLPLGWALMNAAIASLLIPLPRSSSSFSFGKVPRSCNPFSVTLVLNSPSTRRFLHLARIFALLSVTSPKLNFSSSSVFNFVSASSPL